MAGGGDWQGCGAGGSRNWTKIFNHWLPGPLLLPSKSYFTKSSTWPSYWEDFVLNSKEAWEFLLIMRNLTKCIESNNLTRNKGQQTSWNSSLVNKSATLSSTYYPFFLKKWKEHPSSKHLPHCCSKSGRRGYLSYYNKVCTWSLSFTSYITYLHPKLLTLNHVIFRLHKQY